MADNIAPTEGQRLLQEADAVLLDVREDDEVAAGHVAGSVHIRLGDLGARHTELPTDRPIVVICRSGARSMQAASALERAGYQAVNLAGGVGAWLRAGLPLVDADGNSGRVA